MGHSKWDIPPKKDDELFDEFILDWFHHTFGIGPDTNGILDEHNTITATGFFVLTGRSGGQIAYGGTDDGDDLLFHSTSSGTLGHIAFTSLQNGLIWDGEKKALAIGGHDHEMTVDGVTKDHSFTTHSQGGSNAYDIVFHRHSSTSGSFLAGARSRGSEASPKIVQDGDNLLDVYGIGYDGTDYEFSSGIQFEVDGTPGDGDMPGRVVFLTSPDGSGTLVRRAIINSTGHFIIPKASGNGIKVDLTTPTFGFADLIGDQFSKNTGATKPTLATYNGVINSWQFAAGDEAFMTFHIPHDYVLGTEIFLHVHWSHIGTLVTGGTITFKATSIYSKGHNQAAFGAPVSGTFTGTASTTQYQQIISETSYSDPSPSGIQLDTDLLEPDGVIEMTFEVDANDMTVSGGGVPDPFIHYVDIHYQTTGLIGTKAKAPDFYV